MKRFIERFKWLQLLLGLLLVALGVITIVITLNVKEDDYELTNFIVWASVMFLLAGTIIIFDLIAFRDKAEYSSLIGAGILIGVGVFVLVNRDFISQVITTLLPYMLISVGGVLLLKTIILAIKKVPFKVWLLPFVLAVIFLIAGIVFICVKELKQVIYIVVGSLFIVLGAVEIVGYITVLSNKNPPKGEVAPKKGKKKKGEVMKAEPVNEPEPVEEVVEAQPKQIEEQDDIKLIDEKE